MKCASCPFPVPSFLFASSTRSRFMPPRPHDPAIWYVHLEDHPDSRRPMVPATIRRSAVGEPRGQRSGADGSCTRRAWTVTGSTTGRLGMWVPKRPRPSSSSARPASLQEDLPKPSQPSLFHSGTKNPFESVPQNLHPFSPYPSPPFLFKKNKVAKGNGC